MGSTELKKSFHKMFICLYAALERKRINRFWYKNLPSVFKWTWNSFIFWPTTFKCIIKWKLTFVLWNTAFASMFLEWLGFFTFVRIQQISSHLRKPHFRRQNRPMSKPSDDPHQRNTKLRFAATSPISKFIIYKKKLVSKHIPPDQHLTILYKLYYGTVVELIRAAVPNLLSVGRGPLIFKTNF